MRGKGFLAIIVALSLVGVMPTSAAHSTFTQEIKPTNCTNTTINNGINVTSNTECGGVVAPSVFSFTTTDNTPIITGTFDPATMSQLRVLVLGRWYVLGQDSELMVSGNTWRLDLSHISPPLKPGAYTVTVEVITTANQLLRGTGVLKVVASTKGGSLVDTGSNLYRYAVIGSVIIGGALIILILARRRKTI